MLKGGKGTQPALALVGYLMDHVKSGATAQPARKSTATNSAAAGRGFIARAGRRFPVALSYWHVLMRLATPSPG